MKLTVTHQESYSRGQLLLRSFFGIFYIMLPHLIMMIICQIWASILSFFAFWAILFTGKYPNGMFNYQLGMLRWSVRLSARLSNLVDGYPALFPGGTDTLTSLEAENPEKLSRGKLLLRLFFGIIYILIPHAICLIFRSILGSLYGLIAWFSILFAGKYPASMHSFQVGTMRWSTRVTMYWNNMTDEYPPFSGKE